MEGAPQNEKYLGKYEIDKDGFISLKDFSTDFFSLQANYIGKFLDIENKDPEYSYVGGFSKIYSNANR